MYIYVFLKRASLCISFLCFHRYLIKMSISVLNNSRDKANKLGSLGFMPNHYISIIILDVTSSFSGFSEFGYEF